MSLRHWLIALCVAACSSSSPAPSPSAPPPVAAPAPPAPIVPAPNPEPPPAIDAGAALAAAGVDGADCLAAADCASGVCEGEGCDAAHPGHCAKTSRICAHNRVPICGCDGKTTTASSTCPKVRYASRGACP